MKECPYCAEPVQDAAIKCRWCREMLVTRDPTGETAKTASDPATARPSSARAQTSAAMAEALRELRSTLPTGVELSSRLKRAVSARSERLPALRARLGAASRTSLGGIRASLKSAIGGGGGVVRLLYATAALTIALIPFLPGASFSLASAGSPEKWTRTVSAPYYKMAIPLVLPVLGAGIALAAFSPSAGSSRMRRRMLLVLGAMAAMVGAWTLAPLSALTELVLMRFRESSAMFEERMTLNFHLVAPFLAIGTSVAVALLAGWSLPRRGLMILALTGALATAAVLGSVIQGGAAEQIAPTVLDGVYAAAHEYAAVAREEAALAREEAAREREEAEVRQHAQAVSRCRELVVKWAAAMADGVVGPGDLLAAFGSSNPLVYPIYDAAGDLYVNGMAQGVDAAFDVLTDEAARICSESRMQDAALAAPDPPGF